MYTYKKSSSKGFTLIEMIVVVLVIALLAAALLPRAFELVEKAYVTRVLHDFGQFKRGAQLFLSDFSKYPSAATASTPIVLTELFVPIVAEPRWHGPYLDGSVENTVADYVYNHPWGKSYNHKSDATVLTGNVASLTPNDWQILFIDPVAAAGIPLSVATRLDIAVDGVAGAGVGLLRYTAAAPIVTAMFRVLEIDVYP